jgi:hypothetical protein
MASTSVGKGVNVLIALCEVYEVYDNGGRGVVIAHHTAKFLSRPTRSSLWASLASCRTAPSHMGATLLQRPTNQFDVIGKH